MGRELTNEQIADLLSGQNHDEIAENIKDWDTLEKVGIANSVCIELKNKYANTISDLKTRPAAEREKFIENENEYFNDFSNFYVFVNKNFNSMTTTMANCVIMYTHEMPIIPTKIRNNIFPVFYETIEKYLLDLNINFEEFQKSDDYQKYVTSFESQSA